MIDWKAIDAVILEWARLQFPQLDTPQFQFKDQNLPIPNYPFIKFKRDSVIKIGLDEIRKETDLTRPQGQEIALITSGVREFTLTIETFVDEENGATDANCDAMAMMTIMQGTLGQESTEEMLCLGGLAVIQELPISDLSHEQNGEIRSRASMDVRFRAVFEKTEFTGYIDTVNIKSVPCDPPGDDVSGVDLTIPAP